MAIPWAIKNDLISSLMRDVPLSEFMYPGVPKIAKSLVRHLITVLDSQSEQGKVNGNREYSSLTVNKYLFLDLLGRGPLKSMLNWSKAFKALIYGGLFGLKYLGFRWAHASH